LFHQVILLRPIVTYTGGPTAELRLPLLQIAILVKNFSVFTIFISSIIYQEAGRIISPPAQIAPSGAATLNTQIFQFGREFMIHEKLMLEKPSKHLK